MLTKFLMPESKDRVEGDDGQELNEFAPCDT